MKGGDNMNNLNDRNAISILDVLPQAIKLRPITNDPRVWKIKTLEELPQEKTLTVGKPNLSMFNTKNIGGNKNAAK
jgi:hypothetical protein